MLYSQNVMFKCKQVGIYEIFKIYVIFTVKCLNSQGASILIQTVKRLFYMFVQINNKVLNRRNIMEIEEECEYLQDIIISRFIFYLCTQTR